MAKKLQNIRAITQMLSGTHKSQTKTTVGYQSKKDEPRNVGDKWVDSNGVEWEQKDGYKVSSAKVLDAVRNALKSYMLPKICPTCNKDMKDNKYNRKMWKVHKMCFDCVIEMEHEHKINGTFDEYARNLMKPNIEAWLEDAKAEYIITCDGAYRGNKEIPLKSVIDDALLGNKLVKKVIVYTRTRTPISMIKDRDFWWEDEMEHAEKQVEKNGVVSFPAVSMDAEDPLFILYTSGSTGKPKGVVHTVAGYMVWSTYTFVNVFQYQTGQIHFCTADIGWITGHSYIIYGPLGAGGTSLMFEGIPTWPDAGRFWEIVDKHKVDILYTAPTAIRSLMGYGLDFIKGKDLSSLKVLGSVGEPINEEAWQWYFKNIGKERCPIVDTWWQTETGGIMISNLAGVTPQKPAHATLPLPGVHPILVDENGNEITGNSVSGNLCIKHPWPGIIRTTYGDHERCRTNYFATYPNLYFTGDGCMRDEDGNYRITGRVDDVLNVSGHRIGTAEVENAINMHSGVIESAVVGYTHDIKGQGIYAYVIYEGSHHEENLTRQDILQTVSRIIGPIAKPDKIQFVTGLPKTRSGKIMRRILRKIAEGEIGNIGDTSTLLDPNVVEEIIKGVI
jgi:acetyl-CoA synthetase